MKCRLSRRARSDLDDILDHGLATFGERAAEAYLRKFNAAFALLSEHPDIGAVHPGIRPAIRSWDAAATGSSTT